MIEFLGFYVFLGLLWAGYNYIGDKGLSWSSLALKVFVWPVDVYNLLKR